VERLVVDGYNIIHAWPSLKRLLGVSLEAARDKLIERLSVYGLVTNAEVTVVFDSHRKSAARANAEELVEGVRVIFTRSGHSADQVIERIVYGAAGGVVTVATSDHLQSDMVRGMGGAVISATELERRVIDAEADLGRRVQKYAK
jgi:predicted RNA-binding protein with PIN domain